VPLHARACLGRWGQCTPTSLRDKTPPHEEFFSGRSPREGLKSVLLTARAAIAALAMGAAESTLASPPFALETRAAIENAKQKEREFFIRQNGIPKLLVACVSCERDVAKREVWERRKAHAFSNVHYLQSGHHSQTLILRLPESFEDAPERSVSPSSCQVRAKCLLLCHQGALALIYRDGIACLLTSLGP
jgi:hypothetical protein